VVQFELAARAGRVAFGSLASSTPTISSTLQMWSVIPAATAGVTDRLWEVSDLVALLEADERGLERAA